jgi:hypothetical protein
MQERKEQCLAEKVLHVDLRFGFRPRHFSLDNSWASQVTPWGPQFLSLHSA